MEGIGFVIDERLSTLKVSQPVAWNSPVSSSKLSDVYGTGAAMRSSRNAMDAVSEAESALNSTLLLQVSIQASRHQRLQ